MLQGVLFAFAIVGVSIVVAGCGEDPKPRVLSPAERLSLQQLIGQRVIAGFTGTKPPQKLLIAIRQGAVGGVILFADNTPSKRTTQRVTQRLQAAALRGQQPYLLVMTDQEGGDIKRLAWAPPKHSPMEIGRKSDVAAAAQSEGSLTGAALRAAGINVNLAPVADVLPKQAAAPTAATAATSATSGGGATGPVPLPTLPASFLGSRSFGDNPKIVATAACAFSTGLQTAAVAATMKHYPGLGLALTNTDFSSTDVTAPAGAIRAGTRPYEHCPKVPKLVMVSSAKYPSLGITKPASLMPATYKMLGDTGFKGVTITDAYDTAAIKGFKDAPQRAISAGADLVLFGQKTSIATRAYDKLLAAARAGAINKSKLLQVANRILSLKKQLQTGSWAQQ